MSFAEIENYISLWSVSICFSSINWRKQISISHVSYFINAIISNGFSEILFITSGFIFKMLRSILVFSTTLIT